MGEVTKLSSLGRAPGITAPAPITPTLDLRSFDCGKTPLDDWLRYRAIKCEGRTARTYVVSRGNLVVAYYCFSASAVRRAELPKKAQRSTPNIVPMFLIGRLAVGREFQGLGIGKGLLRDALRRALSAAEHVGSLGVQVHAIDDEAAAFYQAFDFVPFPAHPRTFFLPMETIALAYDGI